MEQVLTQQEIDMLLNAMSSGEIDQEETTREPEQKIRNYDFRRPTKLSKEYINTLHMIFEDFSKISSSILSTLLRTNVSLQLATIDQISYDEFIHSIPKFTLVGLLKSAPLNGIQIIELNPQLCMLLVELLCGGLEVRQSNKVDLPDLNEKKNFTEIELAILEDVVARLAQVFQNSWKEIIQIDTVLEGLDVNPQLMQNMSPNEPVVLVTFTVRILETSTFINLCIPYVFFEAITDKLSFHNWFDSNQAPSEEDKLEIQKGMNVVQLELEILLGNVSMKLADFLQLEIGDVIKLDKKITEPLETYVEGKPYYLVRPGQTDQQMAVELLERMEGDQLL
ncbi:flagellar motor switch protein FliM [Enterococcus italicus]